ncbi:MAG: glycosyltransferase family 4 protein [Candidatus Veblenbacteria bacterium]|nr:glycosyltransferase family 4 protein [Candidatus Veblenbacteria bacterium]
MNRTLLITSDFPPRRGGVARYYGGLAQTLPEFAVLTNVLGAGGENIYRTSWTWPGWPRWLPLLWVVPRWKYITKASFLAAGEILPIGTALLFIRLAFGWRYFVFVHGLDVQLAGRNVWKRWLTRQVLARAALVIANSNFTREFALGAGATPKATVVVYPAVSLLSVDKAAVEQLRQTHGLQGKQVVLTVARLVERKGIPWALSAVAELQSTHPNMRYVVVGEGPEREVLAHQAQESGANVIFVGAVADTELAAWYALADVFVLTPQEGPQDVEGFGIVYLEAQAAGVPVVASPVGGVPEAVGECGVFVRNQAELSAALQSLLENPERRRSLVAQGLERVRAFSATHQAQVLRNYLDKLGGS